MQMYAVVETLTDETARIISKHRKLWKAEQRFYAERLDAKHTRRFAITTCTHQNFVGQEMRNFIHLELALLVP